MKSKDLADLLKTASLNKIKTSGKAAAKMLRLKWTSDIAKLISCLKKHPELIPGKIAGADLKTALIVWLKKYQNGLNHRFKNKIAKPSNTKRDPVLEHVLRISNPRLSIKNIRDILENHTLVMAIENNIGSLLEDYIASGLEPNGWISAWGSTLRAVDFYEPKKDKFLQVKNRSNSENSSSMAIRKGTDIKKWDRINAQNGKTHWKELEAITNVSGMSEEGFFGFINEAVIKNPKLFYFEGLLNQSKKND